MAFLLAARNLGVTFDRTVVFGRQNLIASAAGVADAYAEAGLHISMAEAESMVRVADGYMEPLLEALGANRIESLDAANFENSTIIHDLNDPLPKNLRRVFSLVIDGGTLEHVFNYPQALRNCMDAVAVEGHLLIVTPANNYFGHGFYQFSPELFYRALSAANGFQVLVMLTRPEHLGRWRHVSDPRAVGGRVTLTSPWPALLFIVAKRVTDVTPFQQSPQESDYALAWSGTDPPAMKYARWYERLPPSAVAPAKLVNMLYGTVSQRSHFTPIKLDQLHPFS